VRGNLAKRFDRGGEQLGFFPFLKSCLGEMAAIYGEAAPYPDPLPEGAQGQTNQP
jgi:hypothetical protein